MLDLCFLELLTERKVLFETVKSNVDPARIMSPIIMSPVKSDAWDYLSLGTVIGGGYLLERW